MYVQQVTLMKVVLLGSSLASLLLLGASAYHENFGGAWRGVQHDYKNLLIATASNDAARRAALEFPIGYKQLYLSELGEIDRCTTCHLGVENPAAVDTNQPLRRHSGDLLTAHSPDRFGCTMCHEGQGRAVSKQAAHGRYDDGTVVEHIDRPLLRGRAVYTSCGRCHHEIDLYGGEADLYAGPDMGGNGSAALATLREESLHEKLPSAGALAGAEELWRGKQLVVQLGCLGCHKYRGRGGVLGPDLTYVGDKTRHDFDFSRIVGEHTVEQWLYEHFMLPAEVSPDTLMPDMNLSDADARSLALYMKSLHRKSVPASLTPRPAALRDEAQPARGETLYAMFCSACHGREGLGSTVRTGLWPSHGDPSRLVEPARAVEPARGVVTEIRDDWELMVPSLNNADTLAVVSDDYLRYITKHGRSSTNMLAWHETAEGGLTDSEIDRVVAYVRSWEPRVPSPDSISAKRGNVRFGRALYNTRCTGCHGINGRGGIGVDLRAPSFQAVASDRLLAETIVHGRANTAMSAWKSLSADEVSDLVAYIRSWQASPPDMDAVLKKLAEGKPNRKSLRIGRTLYRANCSACHGRKGEGAMGPSLSNDALLGVVDDEYLYRAIVLGRPGTAMPTWKHLSEEDVVDLINFMRSWNQRERAHLEAFAAHGDWDRGRIVYRGSCAGCHGAHAEGGIGPQLSNPLFLASASDAMLRHWISYGKSGTPMRAFLRGQQGITEFSESTIEDLISHLRRFEHEPSVVTSRPGMGIVALGGETYAAVCAACHGVSGQGQTGSALANADFLRSASDGFLQATLILGRDGTEMLAMGKGSQGNVELSVEEIDDVVAFIRNWEHHPPADPSRRRYVTGADILAGRELYGGHCSGCHGAEGKGSWAPRLNNAEFLSAATDGFLLATIIRGRSGTAMRAFGIGAGGVAELPGDDIDNIVAYIRTWAPAGYKPTDSGPGHGDVTRADGDAGFSATLVEGANDGT